MQREHVAFRRRRSDALERVARALLRVPDLKLLRGEIAALGGAEWRGQKHVYQDGAGRKGRAARATGRINRLNVWTLEMVGEAFVLIRRKTTRCLPQLHIALVIISLTGLPSHGRADDAPLDGTELAATRRFLKQHCLQCYLYS
ncbi:MAG: hypothetical protein HC834_05000 [Rhodospirillales bacterium]|nr:hypothetical protein [Rhodospirillales bacterium]